MSGLERAIRNALEQSQRDNADIRARIYHSARQALEAGLRKQDVSDPELVNAQRQKLEAKIREIEFEERQRLAIVRSEQPRPAPVEMPVDLRPTDRGATAAPLPAQTPPPQTGAPAPQQPVPMQATLRPAAPASPLRAPSVSAPGIGGARHAANDGSILGGETRQAENRSQPGHAPPLRPQSGLLPSGAAPSGAAASANTPASGDLSAGDLSDLGVSRRGSNQPAELRSRREIAAERPAAGKRGWFGRRKTPVTAAPQSTAEPILPGAARLDVAAGREQRPRRRRRWISGLVVPLIVLGAAGWGVWWAGNNGLFVLPDLSGDPAATGGSGNPTAPAGFDPRRGFSEDWVDVFVPKGTQGITAAGDAAIEAVAASGGEAVRITSRSPGASGEVAIEVPPAILREMAGKVSTVAVTLQTAADRSVEVAVRCDFASLGDCSRHRFRATQEKNDALFHVSFDRTLAPNQPGHIYLNSDVLGGSLPVYVFSVRILPGQ